MTHGNGLTWRVAARDAVTYPETVTLAVALADASVQQQLLDEAGRHQPHSLADVPRLLGELARRLERPWIAGRLSAVTAGPLNAWVRACVRSQAGHKPKTRGMWRISPPHRPTPVSQLLTESSDRGETPVQPEPALLPDGAEDAAGGFARGLRHARAYAAEHGHLCAPNTVQMEGFAIGLWLANQRAAGPELAPERAAALDALDPWWNPPWNLWWQRIYHRAKALVQAGQPLTPEHGFPGTMENLGTWLYKQCTSYSSLHPGQQRLLADLGITPERALAALPRRRDLKAARRTALDHARAYASRHGHLCAPTSASLDGFTVGKWLHSQRVRARRGQLDHALKQALTDIDPWWNPPWPTDWQREHHNAHAAVTAGALLDPEAGFRNFDDRTGQWLYAQCVNYRLLQLGQQRLLARLGLTKPVAATAVPNPATRHPAMETGLYYARTWAAEHASLDLPRTAQHGGFPLGRWLAQQRHQANLHRELFDTPWPHEKHLARIDPYWNPPWGMKWQRRYQAARAQLTCSHTLAPEEGFPGTTGPDSGYTASAPSTTSSTPTSSASSPTWASLPKAPVPPGPATFPRPQPSRPVSPTPVPGPRNTATWPSPNPPATTATASAPGCALNVAAPTEENCPPTASKPWRQSILTGTQREDCAGTRPTSPPAPTPPAAPLPPRPISTRSQPTQRNGCSPSAPAMTASTPNSNSSSPTSASPANGPARWRHHRNRPNRPAQPARG